MAVEFRENYIKRQLPEHGVNVWVRADYVPPDAYTTAIELGLFTGTRAEWIASLKGNPLTFEQLTPEQKFELRGRPLTFADLTELEKLQIKGEPFLWQDLTPEQRGFLRGETGKSAYDIAVDNGFEGSEQDWLDMIYSLRAEFETLTTAEINALVDPMENRPVYDLTLHKLVVFDGTIWQPCW